MPHTTRKRSKRQNKQKRMQVLQQASKHQASNQDGQQASKHQASNQDGQQASKHQAGNQDGQQASKHQASNQDGQQASKHQASNQDGQQASKHQAGNQDGQQASKHQAVEDDDQASLSLRFTRLFAKHEVEFEDRRGPMPCRSAQLLDVGELIKLATWGVSYYRNLPKILAYNDELVKKLLETHGVNILKEVMLRYERYDPASDVGKLLVFLAGQQPQAMSHFFKSNKDFILSVIKINADAFKYAAYALVSDVDFVLACMAENLKVSKYTDFAFQSLATKQDVETAIEARAYSQAAVDDVDSDQEMCDYDYDDYDDEFYGDYYEHLVSMNPPSGSDDD